MCGNRWATFSTGNADRGVTRELEAAGATFEVKASDQPESECFLELLTADYLEYLDREFPQRAAYLRGLA